MLKTMKRRILLGMGLSALFAGCSMMSAKDAIGPARQPAMDAAAKGAFVEGYLEYVGPAAKWAGPGPLLVHLIARDLSTAEIVVRPDLLAQLDTQERKAEEPRALPGTTGEASGQIARERLGALATAMEADKGNFTGCLYPIRARLIRADGSVVEKFGCRSWKGWPTIASTTVSQMFTLALRERPASATTPNRATASTKK